MTLRAQLDAFAAHIGADIKARIAGLMTLTPTASQTIVAQNDGVVPLEVDMRATSEVPALRVDRAAAVSVSDADVMEVRVQGTPTMWLNEAGLLRVRNPSSHTWDTAVRIIAGSGQTAPLIEAQNHARTQTVWAINQAGATVRSGVTLGEVLVLGEADPVPANTPANTVIVRIGAA